ncbi:DUF305 domain-containing protein [Actinocorallia longicatena]|uniref:DUF305 domain-containing protein n=1 Tax=Actinocorallia longicatena TaxID=111803 RepID=A0ABP6QCN8_9ACTN
MLRIIAPALAAVLLVSGCSGGSADPGTPPVKAAQQQPEDVMFLQMMLPHHEQGLQMVRMARTRAKNGKVRTLAAAIEATQSTEVTTMKGWLTSWNQPLTAPAGSHQEHGGMPETAARLIKGLGGSDAFDRDFLNLMIGHQDDAVQMAVTESADGADPEVKEWAHQVEQSRRGQIKDMLALLKTLR